LSIDVGLKAYGIFGGGVFTLGWSAISIRFAEAPRLVIAAYRMLGAMVLGPGAYTAGQNRALDTRRACRRDSAGLVVAVQASGRLAGARLMDLGRHRLRSRQRCCQPEKIRYLISLTWRNEFDKIDNSIGFGVFITFSDDLGTPPAEDEP